ncbi:MAG: TIGR03960 family B12-binding radical SAM protein, partial [Candidatus Omnitrophica bacterium]|nr:TIGR03960 family B12-binding radical SAM protein [Candidatus Omnitrophota bacterium]
MLEDILLQVNKPGRYIGGEWNLPKKDFAKAEIKFALCFPDLYEVGMSNLGLRIIYSILNNIPDAVCERFFAPDIDMENVLREKHLEIFSLESQRKLREFDIIGFSLAYELNYTNVLNILDLGGIPLESSLRDKNFPLVIAGGPAAFNPEPMHAFFDLFVIGEAEEAVLEIINLYRENQAKFKAGRISKKEMLAVFSQIEGVYAPELYKEGLSQKIKKRFLKSFDNADFLREWLVPYIQIVHDRISLELMRGCPNHCRFCQARTQYFPFRKRQPQKILAMAEEVYQRSGYEELSLSGLSVSDYTNIEGLLKDLIDSFKERGIAISLPSLKPKTMQSSLSAIIATIKKTGLTFAPEAGSERLRRVLGKDFCPEEFFKVIAGVYPLGYQHIKLYFMLGIPFEEKADLDGIIDFSVQVSELKRKFSKWPAELNLSINTLIPKPQTPLQWFKMIDLAEIKDKQDYLKNRARRYR